jgi:hypothetical protein
MIGPVFLINSRKKKLREVNDNFHAAGSIIYLVSLFGIHLFSQTSPPTHHIQKAYPQ